jgi:hypothetical protein
MSFVGLNPLKGSILAIYFPPGILKKLLLKTYYRKNTVDVNDFSKKKSGFDKNLLVI